MKTLMLFTLLIWQCHLVAQSFFERTIGDSQLWIGTDIAVSHDSGYALAGHESFINGSTVDPSDSKLIKLDKFGNEVWRRSFDGLGRQTVYSIARTSDNGFILYGEIGFNSSLGLIKVSDLGLEQWNKEFPEEVRATIGQKVIQTQDGGYSVDLTLDAGLIYLGESNDTSTFNSWHLTKVDSQGIVLWERFFNDPSLDNPSSVRSTSDGGYVIIGNKWNSANTQRGFHLIKVDDQGAIQSERTYFQRENTLPWQFTPTPDGGYALFGTTANFGPSVDVKMHLVKTNDEGYISVSEEDLEPLIVFPNPAEGFITIQKVGENRAELYDIMGKELLETHFKDYTRIDTRGLKPGHYTLKVSNGISVIYHSIVLK